MSKNFEELSTKFAQDLKALWALSGDVVVDDLYSRRVYSKDLWPRNLILSREPASGMPEPGASVDVVVWPSSRKSLAKLVQLANQNNWELYPYGAGSGVCGGATITDSTPVKRPRIVVDLKKMDQIESIDPISQVAKIGAGAIGQVLEENLNAKGFTMGHFPSSIYCSSFGGYLATRAAGQLSTYYGKIEDMVLAIEGVLPDGREFETTLAPRMATGPDWTHLFVGSEGALAFLTGAWVKVHRLAKERRFLSYVAPSTEKALEGVRLWTQEGLRPAVVRIYDEDESKLLMGISEGVKMVCVVEGDAPLTHFTADRMEELADSWSGWRNTGEEPAEHWWAHRYDVSYRQQQIMSHRRMILDTFEVSTVWSKLPALHRAVKKVTSDPELGGMLIVLAHFSHFYHNGGNIYFTLCGRVEDGASTVQYYDRVWEKLLKACESEGAAVSHHHGVGRLKAKAMARSQGVIFELTKKLKHELDQKNILNPENLGL